MHSGLIEGQVLLTAPGQFPGPAAVVGDLNEWSSVCWKSFLSMVRARNGLQVTPSLDSANLRDRAAAGKLRGGHDDWPDRV